MKMTHWLFAGVLAITAAGAAASACALEKGPSPHNAAAETETASKNKGARSKYKQWGWYVGLSVGATDDKGLDDESDGFKLFGGYRFNKYIALEGAAIGLGQDLGRIDASKDAISVQAVGIWPVGKKVELFGKAGFFDWEERVPSDELDCSSFSGGFVCFEEEDKVDDGIDATYGLGLNLHFSRRGSLRVEWERYRDVGEGDVDMLSVGGYFRF